MVTFLMTDVEGSTPLWEEHPHIAGEVIERHDALIGEAVGGIGGVLVKSKGEGDSTFSVFEDAGAAVAAAVGLQRALAREPWPEGCEIRVRAALYTGRAEVRTGQYLGIAPNRGGRLRATAHGGQIVCCRTSKELAVAAGPSGCLPADVSFRDLGMHRLRDIARAESVFQVEHPDLRVEFPRLRSLGVRHNLPAPRTSFIGRGSDRIAVRKHLEAGRLVTLTGVGGSGKTRLAIEVASEQLDRFPDGVFFVDLVPVSDVAVLPAAVVEAVGFARLVLGTGSGNPATELIDYLSTRDVLLVFDNCEHVIDACAALIDSILDSCPGASVLATSREVLELQGEQAYRVPPLGLVDDATLASESVQLFAARAALVRPDPALSSADLTEAAEICRRLDGIPLAIELAAAQVAHLAPTQINQRLDDRFRLLAGGRRRSGRQQTLHAAIDWSHELLTDDERVAFRRMAVFPGGFSSDAAAAVCDQGAASELLRALVRKSMVVVDDVGPDRRYRLLETVRAYAEARLVEAGDHDSARDRHRDHMLAWVESIPAELTYLDPQGRIRRERDNLRTALSWSEAQGRPDLVGRIASTMSRIWVADIAEGRRWLSTGIEGAHELTPEHRVRVLALAAQVAVLAMEAFDGELARRAVEASNGQPGFWSSLAHSLLCLNSGIHGFVTKDTLYAVDVERLGQQAVDLAPEPVSRGLAWFWLGQALVLLDDLDGAIDAFEKGSVEAIPSGDMSPVSLAMLAGTLHIQGRHDEALAAATEVLERAKSFQDNGLWAWELYCSLPYPLELGHHGHHEDALAFMRDLLQDRETPQTPGVMTSVVIALAGLAELRGEIAAAGLLLQSAGESIIASGMRTPIDAALYTHYLGKVNRAIDDDAADRNRARAGEMDQTAAIAFGLDTARV